MWFSFICVWACEKTYSRVSHANRVRLGRAASQYFKIYPIHIPGLRKILDHPKCWPIHILPFDFLNPLFAGYYTNITVNSYNTKRISSLEKSLSRASVKRMYGVYYALRLQPDVQIELQRRTADFRNIFCPSKIDTRDVQKLSKGPPTFNQLYEVCPAYLPEIRYLCWLSFKDVPLSACGSFIDSRVKRSGTLLMAAWSLRVFVTRAELINWCLYN